MNGYPCIILLAIVKAEPNRAFMLSSTVHNFQNVDYARNYMFGVLTNRDNEISARFNAVYNKHGWDGFTFKMKTYEDARIADKAFRKFKADYELLNIPKNSFKALLADDEERAERTPRQPRTPRNVTQGNAPLHPATDTDMLIIEAAVAGKVINLNGRAYRVRLDPQ